MLVRVYIYVLMKEFKFLYSYDSIDLCTCYSCRCTVYVPTGLFMYCRSFSSSFIYLRFMLPLLVVRVWIYVCTYVQYVNTIFYVYLCRSCLTYDFCMIIYSFCLFSWMISVASVTGRRYVRVWCNCLKEKFFISSRLSSMFFSGQYWKQLGSVECRRQTGACIPISSQNEFFLFEFVIKIWTTKHEFFPL